MRSNWQFPNVGPDDTTTNGETTSLPKMSSDGVLESVGLPGLEGTFYYSFSCGADQN